MQTSRSRGTCEQWIFFCLRLSEANGAILRVVIPESAFVVCFLVHDKRFSFESIRCGKILDSSQHRSTKLHVHEVIWNRHDAEGRLRNLIMLPNLAGDGS